MALGENESPSPQSEDIDNHYACAQWYIQSYNLLHGWMYLSMVACNFNNATMTYYASLYINTCTSICPTN